MFLSSPRAEETLIMEEVERAILLTCEVQNGDKLCPENRTLSVKSEPGSTEVTLESVQIEVQLSEPEALAESDEGSDEKDEKEANANRKRKKASADEDWLPQIKTEELDVKRNLSSEEDTDVELELSDHETSSSGFKPLQLCTECGSFFSPLKVHTCKHILKPFSCNVCGRRYATEYSLKRHNKSHIDRSEHCCVYCYATIITKQDKLTHQQIHLNQSNPYQCRHCTSSFTSISERNKHVKGHRGPFEYKCDICGISFRQKFSHERHMAIHTGVKPYKCSVCERSFNQGGHLRSHMRLHTGERPYACPQCNKAFNHNVSLKSHIQRYHPPESEDRLDKSRDGVLKKHDIQELTEEGTAHVDDDVQRPLEKGVKPKSRRYTSGRAQGRPKRPSAVKRKNPRSKYSGGKSKRLIHQ